MGRFSFGLRQISQNYGGHRSGRVRAGFAVLDKGTKLLLLATVSTILFISASEASAQSRFDDAKSRAKEQVKRNEESAKRAAEAERAAKAQREKEEAAARAAEIAAIRNQYGTYIDRGAEISQTLFKQIGSDAFVYNGCIDQIKGGLASSFELTPSYQRKVDNSPSTIANNGIVETIAFTYQLAYPDVPFKAPPATGSLFRQYCRSWSQWGDINYFDNNKFKYVLFKFQIDKKSNGDIFVSIPEDILEAHKKDKERLRQLLIGGRNDLSVTSLPELQCDWESSFNPYDCVSWHTTSAQEMAIRRDASVLAESAFLTGNFLEALRLEQLAGGKKVSHYLYLIGQKYETGDGVAKDYGAALAFYSSASAVHATRENYEAARRESAQYQQEYERLNSAIRRAYRSFDDGAKRDAIFDREYRFTETIRRCRANKFENCSL